MSKLDDILDEMGDEPTSDEHMKQQEHQAIHAKQEIKVIFTELILDQPMIGMQKGLLDTNKVLKAIDEL